MTRFISLAAVLSVAWSATPRAEQPDLLAQLRAYVERYLQQAPSLVAREDYKQTVTATMRTADVFSGRTGIERMLVSEMLMVRLPRTAGWISFRDVMSVDGRELDGRQQRLVDLLQSQRPDALAEARRLAGESARYNVGQLTRTLNVPDIALEYLREAQASRIQFEGPRPETIEGVPLMMFRFGEKVGPTILRDGTGRDLKASGRVWIDATTAALIRTELKVSDRGSAGTCVVDFVRNDALGMYVPKRMTERYRTPNQDIDGVAVYSDYRRFAVSTNETISKPPGAF